MPAKPLTPEQKADADRLNARFKARKLEEPGLTQAVLADDLGFSTQSAVGQYLRGEVPLNVEAAVRFADRLGCMVSDFSPTMQQAIDRVASFSSTNNSVRTQRKSEFIPAQEELARGHAAAEQIERDNGLMDEYLAVANKYRVADPERQAPSWIFFCWRMASLCRCGLMLTPGPTPIRFFTKRYSGSMGNKKRCWPNEGAPALRLVWVNPNM